MVKTTWRETAVKPDFPALKSDLNVDVAIIGGGITGLMNAYLLNKEGLAIALIEKSEIGGHATRETTAFITQYIDTEIAQQRRIFGDENTKLIWESHGDAVNLIESVVKEEHIECEFTRCPNYVFAHDADDVTLLEEEVSAAQGLGFDIKRTHDELGFEHEDAIKIDNQAKFHPLKFLYPLSEKLLERGVQIFENTEALSVEGDGPFEVKAENATIKAAHVISATYAPFDNPLKLFLSKGKYISHILELKIPSGVIKEGIYEDTYNPYHYFRIDPQGEYDRMIVGGEDHRKEIPIHEKSFDALEEWVKSRFPDLTYEIVRAWKGPILEPIDGLAYIGKFKNGILYATGFSGNGMTYGTISAMIFRDIIKGSKNPWVDIYDPNRNPSLSNLFEKGKDYGEEFVLGALKNIFK